MSCGHEYENDARGCPICAGNEEATRLRARLTALRVALREASDLASAHHDAKYTVGDRVPMFSKAGTCLVCSPDGRGMSRESNPYLAFDQALRDTEAAAREHDARVRDEALEEAAQVADGGSRDEWSPGFIAQRIRTLKSRP